MADKSVRERAVYETLAIFREDSSATRSGLDVSSVYVCMNVYARDGTTGGEGRESTSPSATG